MVDPNKITLGSIRTLRGSIDSSDLSTIKKPTKYNFNFVINLNVEREKKLVRFVLEVQITDISNLELSAKTAASFTTEFIYHVGNLEEIVQFDETQMKANLDGGLGVTLASISYSTMRGIIHTRTQGTVLNGIILPVVDPLKLISQAILPDPSFVQ